MSEPLPPRVRRAVFLRSFAVQGSWNYQTLLGTGFAFTVAPALRHVYRGNEAAMRAAAARHAHTFNSHPYLVTVAAGAVARLEAEETPPELVERFKTALRGSLGSLGDRLVWLLWRPACGALGIALLLAGAPWWAAAAALLVSYNALHLSLRAWGLRVGLAHGLQVGKTLRDAPLQLLGERAADVGAVLAGFAAVLALGRAGTQGWEWTAAPLVLAAGAALGFRLRRVAAALFALALAAGLLLERTL